MWLAHEVLLFIRPGYNIYDIIISYFFSAPAGYNIIVARISFFFPAAVLGYPPPDASASAAAVRLRVSCLPSYTRTHITARYGRVGPRAPATQPAHGSQGRNSSLAPRTGPAGLWPSDIWRFPRVLIRFAMPAAKSLVRLFLSPSPSVTPPPSLAHSLCSPIDKSPPPRNCGYTDVSLYYMYMYTPCPAITHVPEVGILFESVGNVNI